MASPSFYTSTYTSITGSYGLSSHPVNPGMAQGSRTQNSRVTIERGEPSTPPTSPVTALAVEDEDDNVDHANDDQDTQEYRTPATHMTAGEDTKSIEATEMTYSPVLDYAHRTPNRPSERRQFTLGRCCVCDAAGTIMTWPQCRTCHHNRYEWCGYGGDRADDTGEAMSTRERITRLNELSGELGLELEALAYEDALQSRQWLLGALWSSVIQLNRLLTDLERRLRQLSGGRETSYLASVEDEESDGEGVEGSEEGEEVEAWDESGRSMRVTRVL
ncbi:hypothetical protein H2204_012322 [Knufia peltigerae]|uniref:Uncharacterized protein n=1 Tax=Knufia peltigerae TaxID=1002370 RepID=A0AA38XSM7_9EURO|nr:hypothetical protein H2204_012322 [Knufia peltigerae]